MVNTDTEKRPARSTDSTRSVKINEPIAMVEHELDVTPEPEQGRLGTKGAHHHHQGGARAAQDTRSADASKYLYTELGNADRLIQAHGADLRYSPERKQWLVWDGRRWAWDILGESSAMMKNVVRQMITTAVEQDESVESAELLKWALSSAREPNMRHSITLAQTHLGIPFLLSDLDRDPWSLNCHNGTINLRTGELGLHDRTQLISKLSGTEYNPEAECPLWGQFLNRIMGGKEELISFLQRAVGYALTGDISEQVWFLLYGTGANGKSTFLEVLKALLGDYSQATDSNTFLTQKGNGVRNDIARLRGARLVTAVEIESNRRLAEVLVKQLTGGDTITARFLYSEHFEFKFQGTLFLAANHRPIIQGTDHAIWRRIQLVPFNVTIPDREQDKHQTDKLLEELPGILAWAVQGCLDWQRDGLMAPDEVTLATREYRNEQDVLGAFLAECCKIDPLSEVAHKDLYAAYTAWCDQTGERPLTSRKLVTMLDERGIEKKRQTSGERLTMRVGLGLQA